MQEALIIDPTLRRDVPTLARRPAEPQVAATDVQRALLLAAGETMWATFNGTAFHVSYNLFSLNLLIVSLVMLRSTSFSKSVAYLGLLAALTNWGLYVPMIGLFLSVLSVVPFYALWNILIAHRLFQLGQSVSPAAEKGN